MPSAPPSVRATLDQIEANMRDVARVDDPLVRKILTAVLERQASYYRQLMALGSTPCGPDGDGPQTERNRT
jgi:hypothetical protein